MLYPTTQRVNNFQWSALNIHLQKHSCGWTVYSGKIISLLIGNYFEGIFAIFTLIIYTDIRVGRYWPLSLDDSEVVLINPCVWGIRKELFLGGIYACAANESEFYKLDMVELQKTREFSDSLAAQLYFLQKRFADSTWHMLF